MRALMLLAAAIVAVVVLVVVFLARAARRAGASLVGLGYLATGSALPPSKSCAGCGAGPGEPHARDCFGPSDDCDEGV